MDILFVGTISSLENKRDNGRGRINILYYDNKLKYTWTYYEAKNSKTFLYPEKLVVFNLKSCINHTGHEAINISDFDVNRHKDLSGFFKRVLDYSEVINPIYHPWLINYFIENNLLYRNFGHWYRTIERAHKSLEEFDAISIEEVIDSYNVRIGELVRSRPGKDDLAIISMISERSYEYGKYDVYLNSFLPNYEKKIARDSYYSSYDIILANLWDEIGGEKKRSELEEKCLKIKETNINRVKREYDKDAHLTALIQNKNKAEREFRVMVQKKHFEVLSHSLDHPNIEFCF